MMLAEADEMIMDDAFLVNVVRPCFHDGSLASAVPALLRVLRHRAHEVAVEKDWLGYDKRMKGPLSVGQMHILGHCALDVLDKTLLKSREMSTEHQLLILAVAKKASKTTPSATSVHSRLIRLLPGLALSQKALDELARIIHNLDKDFRLDVEGTRRLLTFVPHARERLGTRAFLRITRLALFHSAQLLPDDFGCVHSNIRGTLDVVGEYFSSSGAEEVARTESCLDMSFSSNATQPVAEVTISSMPTPREDVDEAPRQHPRAIDGASMV
ncbi:hypothetical protein IEO21_09730 [Rhodonia placenta]|uniref:Uncharacterized protein n=1 Tax=Rhodonia placenta TaxID=104341 RepID=A0A8H7TXG0_9APHY|nr:hypothetical protein IEO21_09730 [Postia placenta]